MATPPKSENPMEPERIEKMEDSDDCSSISSIGSQKQTKTPNLSEQITKMSESIKLNSRKGCKLCTEFFGRINTTPKHQHSSFLANIRSHFRQNHSQKKTGAIPKVKPTKNTDSPKPESNITKNPKNVDINLSFNSSYSLESTVMPPPPTPAENNEANLGKRPPTSSPENDQFKKPNKTVRLADLVKPPPRQVPTKNKFDVITPSDAGQDNTQENGTEKDIKEKVANSKPTTKSTKPKPPPPLIIQGTLHQPREVMSVLKPLIRGKYELKATKNNFSLYMDSETDYKRVKDHLIMEKMSFHSYSMSTEKTHAFVLKGLDGDYSTEEIKEELRDCGVKVSNVYKMNTNYRPMYLVVTTADHNLASIIKSARVIFHTRVTWENRITTRKITQCARCQQWGHSRGNCFRPYKCSKCGQGHQLDECPNKDKAPKCANCGGEHRSMSTRCPVYIFKTGQTDKDDLKYIDAPQPKVNHWTGQKTGTNPPPPSNYNREFPNTLGGPTPRPPTHARQGPPHTSVTNQVSELRDAYGELSKFVDLGELIKAVNHLTSLMKQAGSDPIAKFQLAGQFFTEILPNYNI